MAGYFYNAAFRSEISFEDDESAGRLERHIEFAHNLLRRRFLGRGCFFRESASGNGEAVPAKESSFKEALCDHRSAACCVEIGGDKASSRLEIRENWHPRTHPIQILHAKALLRFLATALPHPHW